MPVMLTYSTHLSCIGVQYESTQQTLQPRTNIITTFQGERDVAGLDPCDACFGSDSATEGSRRSFITPTSQAYPGDRQDSSPSELGYSNTELHC